MRTTILDFIHCIIFIHSSLRTNILDFIEHSTLETAGLDFIENRTLETTILNSRKHTTASAT